MVKQFYLTYGTLTVTINLGKIGLWSNVHEGVVYILQSSSIIEASLSNCLVSYSEHLLRGFYLSAGLQLAFTTALADWAM